MQPDQPLLTIAIPTYNRSAYLAELLTVLAPQLEGREDVDLLICDNGSPDATADVVDRFQRNGLKARFHRHERNIGSDGNFVTCFDMARGRYYWLLADDDILVPGALNEILEHLKLESYDLVYATSYGFREDWNRERQGDPLGRSFHRISDAMHFTRVSNIMLTFISGVIVNRERLLDLPHDPIDSFCGTNLIQLGWVLPLLRQHRQSLVLWSRPVAGRQGNSGGYAIGTVFGQQLKSVTSRCLPDRPDLAACIVNFTIRRWFPTILIDVLSHRQENFGVSEAATSLRAAYGDNFRFWLFLYPVLKLPLGLAKIWCKCGTLINKLIYIFLVPSFWRKRL